MHGFSRRLTLVLLACGAPAAAVAQQPRLGPGFQAVRQLGRAAPPPPGITPRSRDQLARAARGAAGPFAAIEATEEGPVVHALARVRRGGEAALRAAGASIGARAGDIVALRFPLAAIDAVAAASGVAVLEAAARLEGGAAAAAAAELPLATDSADDEIRVSSLRRRVDDRFVGLAGQGVIVGLVDSGLDLQHGDFLRPDGHTRVLAAWDQTATGTPPGVIDGQTFDYGAVCTPADIDGGDCPLDDTYGHGTHVAGIAAGDGSATGNDQPAFRFTGAAPEAGLIVVRGDTASTFLEDRVVDGVAWIFAMADALNRPAVVVLSLGAADGPHDGTTLSEQAFDNMSGPGRIIVAATGNQGASDNENPGFPDGPRHDEGVAGDAVSLLVPAYNPLPDSLNDLLIAELWYDGADSLDIVVTTPGGLEVRTPTGDSSLVDTPEGGLFVVNALDGVADNGDHQALILFADLDAAHPPAQGTWTITPEAAGLHSGTGGAYHAWLDGYALDLAVLQIPHLPGGTNRYLVARPASADRVLAVAAYASLHRWATVGGDAASIVFQEPVGDIAFMSAPGPRRDGVLVPDLAAPGKVVMSALARNATLWDGAPSLIEADDVHVALFGTSMAAPQVGGTVALLLQLDPTLDPGEVRELLVRTARQDAFTPHPYTGDPDAVPNVQWGYGKLDAAAAAQRLRPEGIAPDQAAIALSANPVHGDALVLTYAERPDRVTVYSLTGRLVRDLGPADIGPLTTVWGLDNNRGAAVANGPYLLVVELAGRKVLRKVLVARP